MVIIYDLIFLVIVIIYLPVYLLRKKLHSGFFLRLGFLPKDLNLNNPIWVHAVSVGEAAAVKGLIEELRIKNPGKKFVISTVTATGNRIAQGIAKSGDFVTYLPFDFSFIIRRVIAKIDPVLFVIAETEIWPNLIDCLHDKNIPLVIVNGRISDSSFRGYLRIKILLARILRKINLFCVQTNRDAQRLMQLGVSGDKIRLTGNMKFDIKREESQEGICADYKLKLGLNEQERLLVAGSTHPGEEEAILSVYKDLANEFSELRLLIAPRHPERSKEVAQIVSDFGFQPVLISSLPIKCGSYTASPVFILDIIGQLFSFYALSDIVFVGGSLIKKGGHNILEPASLGKPVLFGPYMFNFRDISELFLRNHAAIQFFTEEELKKNIRDLFYDPQGALALGQKAKQLILQNQGATHKNAEFLMQYLLQR